MNGNYNRKNVMILNVTLKMILRSWWRNKVFFLVSVASLALGLACTNLLMTYFVHEHGLEGSNPDRDRIVFLRQDDPMNEGKRVAYAAADIPQRLKDSYAEVEDYCGWASWICFPARWTVRRWTAT